MMYTMSHPDHDRPKRNITKKMSSAGPNTKVTSKNYDWKKNLATVFPHIVSAEWMEETKVGR